ncbi:TIGR02466 family protein [Candidatus Phycosocius spiralis]|uniref:2OG-Fe(II) oxygenase-related protein n=1 Tax=Candidatus Phycosocius spiralis TaxID=2815099 RepID=A0ABQ4PU74_9PROT|nr:TIGR02466 family protein [Candidatus Phycosocius spiralis]GIU66444.1 2OG-Fe(II) oxygenase-related protein [Candidatus Phycosocius spiralis]
MTKILSLFATRIYRAPLGGHAAEALRFELARSCDLLSMEDKAGQAWCKTQNYLGYTSYASLTDLPTRMSGFGDLKRRLDKHVARFSEQVGFELAGGKLKLDSLWVNVLPKGGVHSGHIHPHSVISGTYYVSVPDGASTLKFEDPRLAMMMAAPTRRPDSAQDLQPFIFLTPEEGEVILWESWLRHEVVMNRSTHSRISISFNYAWT